MSKLYTLALIFILISCDSRRIVSNDDTIFVDYDKEQIFDKTAEIPLQDFVARVIDYDPKTKLVTIEQRNNFSINTPFEVLSPNGIFKLEIKELWNKDNEKVEVARHAKEVLYFKSDIEFTNFDMFRQIKSKN